MKILFFLPLLFISLVLKNPLFTTPTIVAMANGVTTTLTITHQNANCKDNGADFIELNGRSSTGTGLPMQWAWTWSKVSYTGAGTGKAAFENINAPQTQVDSLEVGTYVFQGSAVDISGGAAGTASVTVVVNAASSCPVVTVDTIGTPNTNQFLQFIGSTESNKIHYVRGGSYQAPYMRGCTNVTFLPVPGTTRVIFIGDWQIGETGAGCSNITIDGSGVTGLTGRSAGKGILIYSSGVSGHAGIYRIDSSRNFTLKNLEIAGSLNIGGTNGQGIGLDVYNQFPNDTTTNPLSQTHGRLYGFNCGNDTLFNLYLHGLYNEAVYDGSSHFGWKNIRSLSSVYLEPVLNHLYMANVITDTSGQSAMNWGACANGGTIENCQFLNYATRQQFGHNAGINVNPGTRRIIIRNNYFYNSTLPTSNEVQGISYHGAGSADLIYNNIFENIWDPLLMLRSTDANEGRSDGNVYAYDNTLIRPTWWIDIYSFNFSSPSAIHAKNNLAAGAGMTSIASGNDWTGLDSSNNILSNVSLAAAKFTDTTNHIFTIQSNSPAVGAGLNLSANFTTDYAGNTRNIPFDVGAYQFNYFVSSPSSSQLIIRRK